MHHLLPLLKLLLMEKTRKVRRQLRQPIRIWMCSSWERTVMMDQMMGMIVLTKILTRYRLEGRNNRKERSFLLSMGACFSTILVGI
nr:hypothetical protein Iba_chr09cCG8090 [Ipomoea batatas]